MILCLGIVGYDCENRWLMCFFFCVCRKSEFDRRAH